MSQAIKDMIEADVESLCQQFAEDEIDHTEFYSRMKRLGFDRREAGDIAANFNPQF